MTLTQFAVLIFASIHAGLGITNSLVIYTTEAFFVPINRNWFSIFSTDDDLEYRVALLDMPDLPRWMHCRHPNGSNDAFLYGAAEEPGDIHIEIIALNKNNYETSRKVVKFSVEQRREEAHHEVEMKFLNLNVEDMFEENRLSRLIEIFKSYLWKNSDSVYITMVASSVDAGGRVPLNPREKEGVVVRIGGTDNFSRDLFDLEREVQPLRSRSPCPRDYKRTSAEHLFRHRNLISDWCSFHLVPEEKGLSWPDPVYSSISLTSDNFKPQSNLPTRDLLIDFIVSLVIPAVVVFFLLTALTCIMCCRREGLEIRNKQTPSVQLNQYNSVQRATGQLRHLTAKRDSLPCSGSTPCSSLPQSCTGSPSSTLAKASTPRPSSRAGALRGIMPPPPPYTPPNVTSRRSVSLPQHT